MAIGSGELDRIADDIYRERRITGSVFCGRCGYDLRTLPFVYTCPECGNEYIARPLHLKGIFQLYEAEFPLRDAAATLVSGLSAVLMGLGAFSPPDLIRMVITLFFGSCAILFARSTYLGGQRYLRARSIMKRIELEREDYE